MVAGSVQAVNAHQFVTARSGKPSPFTSAIATELAPFPPGKYDTAEAKFNAGVCKPRVVRLNARAPGPAKEALSDCACNCRLTMAANKQTVENTRRRDSM